MTKRTFSLMGVVILLALFTAPARAQSQPVIYLFWGDGCPHCEVARPILREIATQQGVALREYEIWHNAENQAIFQQMATSLGFEPRAVPTIIIGNQYWEGFGDSTQAELEAAIAACLQNGCPDPALGLLPAAGQPDPAPMDTPEPVVTRDNGFTLAIVTLLALVAALLYSIVAFAIGKTPPFPAPVEWLIPVLIVLGMGVAGYLTYVETQSVEAVCGPVGDCNAVQTSRYATLFGILPVGLLGLLGYLGLLAAWLAGKLAPNLQKAAALAFWGMALFAVIFSAYLTYLEPFVIRAVCIWCITSAWIALFLLVLGMPNAIRQFSEAEE